MLGEYIIINPVTCHCNYANGNAWLVQNIHLAENADEEMLMLGTIDTKAELVADREYEALLPQNIQLTVQRTSACLPINPIFGL